MTDIDLSHMLSCIFGGGLAMLLVALVTVPSERPDGTHEFLMPERFGMGVMCSATVMLLPQLYTQMPTVFDPWATTLLWAGAFIFFLARAYRAWRHRWGNWRQSRMYRR